MRRFSQRNSLVTLSDINITPLLDLAFVLLIIFVIISPSIRSANEQSIQLKLPKGGQPDRKIDAKDVLTVEVSPQNYYVISGVTGRRLGIKEVQTHLLTASRVNPNLVVSLRADENSAYKLPAAVLDFCQNNGIACHLKTEPPPR
jgi:biopolymer transport protein ExbD